MRLRVATEIANERIWNEAQANPELSGMGATVTATIVQDGLVYIAQVGDSRAYLIRGQQIKQLTKDQSFVQMLIDAGAIQPEQAASIPQNVIMQALGTQPNVKVAMTTIRLCRNDCLLLCSDGLSNKLGPDEMKQAVEQSDDLKGACRALINVANERGGEDNITVVLARFDGDGLQAASESQTITGSLTGTHEEFFAAAGNTYGTPPPPDPGQTSMLRIPVMEEPQANNLQPPVNDMPAAANPLPPPAPPMAAAPMMAAGEPTPYVSPEFASAGHVQYKKKSYAAIILITLAALLLIAATVYFFYRYYVRRVAPPAAEPPAASEPATSEPATGEPASQSPATEPPASQPPAGNEPASQPASQPASDQPGSQQP